MTTKLFLKLCSWVIAFTLATVAARADLKWESKELVLTPGPLDTEVSGEYRFVNSGTYPVTIVEVVPGCGCTTAELEKKVYAPGEEGRIPTSFSIGNRQGKQMKPIRVTIEGETEPTILMLVVNVPSLLYIDPLFTYWESGEGPSTKVINLKVMPNSNLTLKAVTSNEKNIVVKLEPGKEANDYRLLVTATETGRICMAELSLETDIAGVGPKTYKAYAQVKSDAAPTECVPK